MAYDVQKRQAGTSTWSAPIPVESGLSYLDSGLLEGQSMEYQVRERVGAALSAWTATVSATTPVPTAGQRPPFDPGSIYRKSFAERYGSNAAVPIHSGSDLMVEAMRRKVDFPSAGGGNGTIQTGSGNRYFKLRSDPAQFTLPVYIVTAQTPIAKVRISGRFGESTTSGTTATTGSQLINNVPIDPLWKPAAPNINNDSNSDSQVVIWDRDNVLAHPQGPQMWDFWQCSQVATGDINTAGVWAKNGSNEYLAVNGSHSTGEATSNGIYPGYISRGAGVPYVVGLTFAWELDAAAAVEGTLDHPIALAYASPDNRYVSPATKSDGTGHGPTGGNVGATLPAGQSEGTVAAANEPYSGPQGAYFKLNENFPIETLSDARARVIARTMRDYGLVVIDNTGNPKMYLESTNSASYVAPAPTLDLVADIPMEAYHAVDWTGTGNGGAGEIYSANLPGGIAGMPAVLGRVTGTAPSGGGTVVSASHTPTAGELILAITAEKGTDNEFVTGITGNGMTSGWQAGQLRSYARSAVYATGQRNAWFDVWAAVAPSGVTAGAMTATSTNSAADALKAIEVLRLTAGSRPVRIVTRAVGTTDTNSPSVKIKGAPTGSLLVGIVANRQGSANDLAGWTATGASITVGTGGTAINLRVYTKAADGTDITFDPTLTVATEWVAGIIEVT